MSTRSLPARVVVKLSVPLFRNGFGENRGSTITAATVSGAELEAVAPALSATVATAVQFPAAYVCVAVGDVCETGVVASAKSNRSDTVKPSGSVDPEASAV